MTITKSEPTQLARRAPYCRRRMSSHAPFYLTSCMSSIADPFCRALADYLASHLDRPVRFVEDLSHAERERLLESGEIQLGWMCGLLYVQKALAGNLAGAPVAAPVMQGVRYGNAPVYFADVIVHRTSTYHTWADLRGATWAYNEEASYSGFHMLLAHMARRGERRAYFGREVVSGSHLESIRMVREGMADVAAIDSTVLDAAISADVRVREDLRVVESVGPRPMPPWVLSDAVAADVRATVQRALLTLHHDPSGARALAAAQMAHLVDVDDGLYDLVRRDVLW